MNDLVTSRQAPRRDFIKVAAGPLSAAAFSGYAAGSDTIRVGVLGCGGGGEAAAPNGINMVRAACEMAANKGLCVMSGLQSRYHPGYQETMKRVHDGAIGDIVA